MGQPLKLLKSGVKDKILVALSKGATYRLTCGYAGIAYQTFRDWQKKGEKLIGMSEEEIAVHPDKVYYDFYCDVKFYESVAALKWLEKIDKASDFHWQAAAWKLERRYPEEYGRTENSLKNDAEDSSISRAKEEVGRLKEDNHGRSSQSSGGTVI